MYRLRGTGRPAAILAVWSLLFVFISCAPVAREGVPERVDREAEPHERGIPQEEAPSEEEIPAIYDLEEEMHPENMPVDPEELEQDIEPLVPDTVAVEEMALPETGAGEHDLGYRIQIFATGELPKAQAMRDAAMARTGYAAYIEFEGDLYKVRLGNFANRGDAAAVRSEIVELYPDCWIVQTTIRR